MQSSAFVANCLEVGLETRPSAPLYSAVNGSVWFGYWPNRTETEQKIKILNRNWTENKNSKPKPNWTETEPKPNQTKPITENCLRKKNMRRPFSPNRFITNKHLNFMYFFKKEKDFTKNFRFLQASYPHRPLQKLIYAHFCFAHE